MYTIRRDGRGIARVSTAEEALALAMADAAVVVTDDHRRDPVPLSLGELRARVARDCAIECALLGGLSAECAWEAGCAEYARVSAAERHGDRMRRHLARLVASR